MPESNGQYLHLKPVIALMGYCYQLPDHEGSYTCDLYVQKGDILFRHKSYDLQIGTWCNNPDNGDAEEILIHAGEHKIIHLTCGIHDGQSDMIYISNASYLKPADCVCKYNRTSGKLAS